MRQKLIVINKIAVFTSATSTYIDRASVLAESINKFHPSFDRFLLFPDESPKNVDLSSKIGLFTGVITLTDLGLSEQYSWIFGHDVIELCTAAKPFALCHLLSKGYSTVIYLDPDTCLFSKLNPVLDALKSNSVVLTPHQLKPETSSQAIVDNEVCSLNYGVYNLGFVAVSNDNYGIAFAHWWRDRCSTFCIDDPANGHFTDQKMCDLVPALFERVSICRHAGLNVASWNISQREIEFNKTGDATVNKDYPLIFFHFTKINHVGEVMLKRYCQNSAAPLELMQWYLKQLSSHHVSGIPARYWRFGTFSDGTEIERAERRLYRFNQALRQRISNPFEVSKSDFAAITRDIS